MIWPDGFEFNPKQKEAWRLMQGPQRHTMLVGGARSSKTFTIVLAITQRALRAPGSRHLIARAQHNAVMRAVWLDTFPTVMRLCFPTVEYQTHRQDGYITLPNGSEIWMGGLDEKERVEKILGMEFVTTFFNECSQISYNTITTVRTRLAQLVALGDGKGFLRPRAYYDLNPTGTGHWTHRLFIEKIDPESRRPVAEPEEYKHMFMNPRDNIKNIAAGTIQEYESLPERQRKRFLDGQYQTEIDGALWNLEIIDRQRIELDRPYDPEASYENIPAMQQIEVCIDPSGTSGDAEKRSNEVGIVVVGKGTNGHGYVFEDLTINAAPEAWARRAVNAYHKYRANRVIAETNYGGDMVRAAIHAIDRDVPVRVVTASRGKHIRAEPISALYAKSMIWHVGPRGIFARLEDQLCNFSTAGYEGDKSPDRADAMIWGATDLLTKAPPPPTATYRRSLPIFRR